MFRRTASVIYVLTQLFTITRSIHSQNRMNWATYVPCEGVLEDLAAGGEDELVGGDDAAVALDAHVAEHALLARHEALQLPVERRQVQAERRRRRRQGHRVRSHFPPKISRKNRDRRQRFPPARTTTAQKYGRTDCVCWAAGRRAASESFLAGWPSRRGEFLSGLSRSMIQLQERSSIMSHQL